MTVGPGAGTAAVTAAEAKPPAMPASTATGDAARADEAGAPASAADRCRLAPSQASAFAAVPGSDKQYWTEPGSPSSASDIESLFIDSCLPSNCVDAVTNTMGYHPKYLESYRTTQNFILRGDGPLPLDYRHYIAIMAAARHQCSYLIDMQKQEFLLQGGNQMWLRGLNHIPQKLHDLYEINKILAHRPWLLNKSHIEKLTKGQDSWSLAEVVHALVLLVHFHALASFVFGSGINDEQKYYECDDAREVLHLAPPPRSTKAQQPVQKLENKGYKEEIPIALSPTEPEVGVDMLMERMKTLSERSEEVSAEEYRKRFEHVESQSAELPLGQRTPPIKPDISHFIEDPKFTYVDFAHRGVQVPTFRVQDCSWEDHGFSLLNGLYNDVGILLDDKFKTTASLTYNTMGGRRDVDTTVFRRAIWNYCQCMYGIRHDDYDYGEVNQLVERSLKAFIKTACCFPERLTKRDCDKVMKEFLHSEKIHVNLMILEARMQAELMYALRALMHYTT